MKKVFKPFVVLSTYAFLYAVTYVFLSALISVVFWTDYFDIVQGSPMIIMLIIAVAAHLIYATSVECTK